MPWLLGILSYCLFILASPFLLLHPKLREGIAARLGFYGSELQNLGENPRIWVHGASAGDVLALLPTVRELRRIRQDVDVVATTITNSGRQITERETGSFDASTYSPYDIPFAVRRALDTLKPSAIVLEYTELWPQLIIQASKRNIPLFLHNGRLSQGNLQRYRILFAFTGNLLRKFNTLLMRDDSEAERARQLDAAPHSVVVTGNTKFDGLAKAPDEGIVEELRSACGLEAEDIVWVAGSTHEGEEEILLRVFSQLRRSHPVLKLIVAPRYADRAEKIVSLCVRQGIAVGLRSSPSRGRAPVIILDTIGELSACYSLADVVFVGGSFVDRGGQNILEPAARGCPVLFGPNMWNFDDAVQALLGRGGLQAATEQQLLRLLDELLAQPEQARALGKLARDQVLSVSGAATRNAELILGSINSR
jgi:3-deoxy-D-manno-octulosonic-acid transferase